MGGGEARSQAPLQPTVPVTPPVPVPPLPPQSEYDPRVASRIAAGEPSRAADYIQLARDRAELIAEATHLMAISRGWNPPRGTEAATHPVGPRLQPLCAQAATLLPPGCHLCCPQAPFDAFIYPTVPLVAPTIAEADASGSLPKKGPRQRRPRRRVTHRAAARVPQSWAGSRRS